MCLCKNHSHISIIRLKTHDHSAAGSSYGRQPRTAPALVSGPNPAKRPSKYFGQIPTDMWSEQEVKTSIEHIETLGAVLRLNKHASGNAKAHF